MSMKSFMRNIQNSLRIKTNIFGGHKTMRKREFVGVAAVFGVFCTVIGFIAYRKGLGNGFIKGYRETDRQKDIESIKSV